VAEFGIRGVKPLDFATTALHSVGCIATNSLTRDMLITTLIIADI